MDELQENGRDAQLEMIQALSKELLDLKHRLGAMEEAVGVLTLHAPQHVNDAALEAQKAYYELVKGKTV